MADTFPADGTVCMERGAGPAVPVGCEARGYRGRPLILRGAWLLFPGEGTEGLESIFVKSAKSRRPHGPLTVFISDECSMLPSPPPPQR